MGATVAVLAPPGAATLAALVFGIAGWRRATTWLLPGVAVVFLAAGAVLAVAVGAWTGSVGGAVAAAGVLRADALTAFQLLLVGAVALPAGLALPAHLRAELAAGRASPRGAGRQAMLVALFLAAMAVAAEAASLGLVWVAIEATTIVTAFLVGSRRTRASVEAAWKYVVICSSGIALALLGTVLLQVAAVQASGDPGLDIAALTASAAGLDPEVTRLAVALLVLGFGTKAGLAPLHAWLPDAHAQAPAPVSALMSGVLLAVAFCAVLRVRAIADGALGPDFTRTLLLVVALASMLLAATLLIAQRDYKRMLAYSSIGHLGTAALGAAIGGPAALAAVLLLLAGHGPAKAVLFLGAGRMTQVTGTSRIEKVRGALASQPVVAGAFGVGMLALVGLPPFALFAAELGIARAGLAAGPGVAVATVVALVLVLVSAGALLTHTGRMLLGPAPAGEPTTTPVSTPSSPAPTSPAPASPVPGSVRGAGATATLAPEPVATAPAPQAPAAEAPAAERPAVPAGLAVALVGGLATCLVLGVAAQPLTALLQAAAATLGAP